MGFEEKKCRRTGSKKDSVPVTRFENFRAIKAYGQIGRFEDSIILQLGKKENFDDIVIDIEGSYGWSPHVS